MLDGGRDVAELDSMDGSESHFDAKFLVLAENVRHHIQEEENEMLPKAMASVTTTGEPQMRR